MIDKQNIRVLKSRFSDDVSTIIDFMITEKNHLLSNNIQLRRPTFHMILYHFYDFRLVSLIT